jgi:hypothetical protein
MERTVIFAMSFKWDKEELHDIDYYEEYRRKMWFIKKRAEIE